MDTRKVATEYRLTQWAQTIQSRIDSGQSIKDFCAAEGIGKNTYFYWQRKLREAACAELAKRDENTENALVPNRWTQLESAEAPSTGGASLTIEIGGCNISVSDDADLELLIKVCRTLKRL